MIVLIIIHFQQIVYYVLLHLFQYNFEKEHVIIIVKHIRNKSRKENGLTNMRKKYLTKIICLCLTVVLATCICKIDFVKAVTNNMTILDITKGNITIGNGTVSGFDEQGNMVSEPNANGYHIVGHNETTFNNIKVTGGTHNVILENVIINQGNFELSGSGTNVTAILAGVNEIYSPHWTAAVQIPVDTTFIISEDSTGSLKAVGTSKRSSGIGVPGNLNMGTFIINGGVVEAIGNGGECTAIGTGFNGSGGQIIINGGYVSAKIQNTSGGYGGAPVGGGFSSSDMNSITVNGGTVVIEGPIHKVADLIVNGGSLSYSSSDAIPHDSENNPLTRRNLLIPGISQVTAIDKITLAGSIMNTKDVLTDSSGYITLFVPAEAIDDELKVTVGDNEYIGTLDSGIKMNQSEVLTVSILKKTNVMIQVNAEDGAEYSLDGGNSWKSDGVFTGLTPATEYKVVARMAESDICWPGSISTPFAVKTKRNAPNAPQAPELIAKTCDSIIVREEPNQEYATVEDGLYKWQESGKFTGLKSEKEYNIVTRVKETEDAMASPLSDILKVTTLSISQADPDVPPVPPVEEKVLVDTIQLNTKAKTLYKGKTTVLTPSVKPANADNKNVTWKSSNPKVATVDAKGKVTAKGHGEAIITATAVDGSKKSASCKITVPYNITYRLNKGKNHKKNPSSYYKNTVKLKNPTRRGYVFDGWYQTKQFKKKVRTISSKSKKNHVLYAKWKKVKVSPVVFKSLRNKHTKTVSIQVSKVSKAKGYEVTYATNKSFKKAKTVSSKTNKLVVKNLRPGQKYYFKVRAYKYDSLKKKVYGGSTKLITWNVW